MPRADFYILTENSSPTRFACTIAAKACQQGNTIHIAAPTREEAMSLDDLLWTFQDISFLPHALIDDAEAGTVPVSIGWGETLPVAREVLINLTPDIPAAASTFDRVIEIVAPTEPLRQQARERYRHYRDLGFELHSHDIRGETANA